LNSNRFAFLARAVFMREGVAYRVREEIGLRQESSKITIEKSAQGTFSLGKAVNGY
jgi:hypothetical protein